MKAIPIATGISLYSGAVGALSVPAIALILGVDEFGRSVYLQALALWGSFAATFGLPYQLREMLAKTKETVPASIAFIGSNFMIYVAFAICSLILLNFTFGFLTISELAFVCVYCLVHAVFTIDQSYDLGLGSFVLFARKQAEYVTISSVGSVLICYSVEQKWELRLAMQIIGLAVPMFIRAPSFSKVFPFHLQSFRPQLSIFKRSMVISVHSSVDKVYNHLDKVLVKAVFGDAALGSYAFAMSIASGLNLVFKMPIAWFERGTLGQWSLDHLNRRFFQLFAAVTLSAAAVSVAIVVLPATWFQAGVMSDFTMSKTLLALCFFYVAFRMTYMFVYSRFLRLSLALDAMKYDLILVGPVAIGATLFALHSSVNVLLFFLSVMFFLSAWVAFFESSSRLGGAKGTDTS